MKILGRKSECRAVSPDLWDFVGERLPENALERVEKHLTVCADCQNEVEGMRRAQNLLRDCRSSVPAPRSDWHDLQNRMRAEGMISPLSGRILLQHPNEVSESPRPSRRPIWALNWERLSLAGSVAATLLLSISIYRLTMPQSPDFASRDGMAPNLAAQSTVTSSRASDYNPAPLPNLGKPYQKFLMPVNLDAPIQMATNRKAEATPRTFVQNRASENQEPEAKTESPIVWEKSPRPHSSAPPQKYVVRDVPSRSEQKADDTALVPPALDMSKNAQDAKTRYIMQRLTPASYNEEGIY